MTIALELTLWHVISLAIGLLGVVAGVSKLLLAQVLRRLDERFQHMEQLRQGADRHYEDRIGRLEQTSHDNTRALAQLQADLPVNYQRREDAVRGESILHAKFDALSMKIDRALTTGGSHGP